MNDEEVKQLLRELAEKADKQGKSESVRIFLDGRPGRTGRHEKGENNLFG